MCKLMVQVLILLPAYSPFLVQLLCLYSYLFIIIFLSFSHLQQLRAFTMDSPPSTQLFLFALIAFGCVPAAICSGGTNSTYDNVNVPCSFRDSINITDGYRDSDDSILFDGLLFRSNDYGSYNYEFINDTVRRAIQPHLRGCICRLKDCVRMCCPRGQHYNESKCNVDEKFANINIDILESDNSTTSAINLFDTFAHINGRPCGGIFELEPKEIEEDRWGLLRVSITANILVSKFV